MSSRKVLLVAANPDCLSHRCVPANQHIATRRNGHAGTARNADGINACGVGGYADDGHDAEARVWPVTSRAESPSSKPN